MNVSIHECLKECIKALYIDECIMSSPVCYVSCQAPYAMYHVKPRMLCIMSSPVCQASYPGRLRHSDTLALIEMVEMARMVVSTWSCSWRRSDLKYLHLQIWTVFPSTLLSDGDSVYSRETLWEILETPKKTCLICTGTPVKTCWKFGSRNYLKSDLLRV